MTFSGAAHSTLSCGARKSDAAAQQILLQSEGFSAPRLARLRARPVRARKKVEGPSRNFTSDAQCGLRAAWCGARTPGRLRGTPALTYEKASSPNKKVPAQLLDKSQGFVKPLLSRSTADPFPKWPNRIVLRTCKELKGPNLPR